MTRSWSAASATWTGAGIIGFEADFGSTPNFFDTTTGSSNFGFGDSNVTTLMGNLVLAAPVGGTTGMGLRSYGSAGIGLFRTNDSAAKASRPGFYEPAYGRVVSSGHSTPPSLSTGLATLGGL